MIFLPFSAHLHVVLLGQMVSELPHEAARKFTVVLVAFDASLSFHAMLFLLMS